MGRNTDQRVQRPMGVRLVALWVCCRIVDEMYPGSALSMLWDPEVGANPYGQEWQDRAQLASCQRPSSARPSGGAASSQACVSASVPTPTTVPPCSHPLPRGWLEAPSASTARSYYWNPRFQEASSTVQLGPSARTDSVQGPFAWLRVWDSSGLLCTMVRVLQKVLEPEHLHGATNNTSLVSATGCPIHSLSL